MSTHQDFLCPIKMRHAFFKYLKDEEVLADVLD